MSLLWHKDFSILFILKISFSVPNRCFLYQVLVNFAKRFHGKKLKCEKLADDGRQVMVKVCMAFG
jgi:hypothetical protein